MMKIKKDYKVEINYMRKIILIIIALINIAVFIFTDASYALASFNLRPSLFFDKKKDIVVQELPSTALDKSYKLSSHVDGGAVARVIESGFIFNEYVRMALYDRDFGFYGSGRARLGSDFGTFAIALSPVYGEMMAEHIFNMWRGMISSGTLKENETFYIVECGAGTGIMARDILNYISNMAKTDSEWAKLYGQLKYMILEVSAKHIESQKNMTQAFSDKVDIRMTDALKIEQELGVGSIKGVIITDELIDSLESYNVKFNLDGSVEIGVVIAALNKELLERCERETGINILDELEYSGIVSRERLLEEHARINVKDKGRLYMDKEAFVKIKKALSRKGFENLEKLFNLCIENVMFYVPIQEISDQKIKDYIAKHIDEISTALSKSKEDIEIYLIPDGDGFIMSAGRVLDKGYVITMDSGDSLAKMFEKGGGNIVTYVSDITQPYYLGHTGTIDICVSPIFTTLGNSGKDVGLDTVFFGKKFNLEKGIPVKITTGDNDERLIHSFALNAIYMNLEDWSLKEQGFDRGLWDEFRGIVNELLKGKKPSQIEGWVDLEKITTVTPVSYRVRLILEAVSLIKYAHSNAIEMIPIWKKRFKKSHHILIQQKRGTDISYSFEGTQEPLFGEEAKAKRQELRAKIMSCLGINAVTPVDQKLGTVILQRNI
jgi:SAM-dependent MidA family methyltransferase